jgi:hypothetical protein
MKKRGLFILGIAALASALLVLAGCNEAKGDLDGEWVYRQSETRSYMVKVTGNSFVVSGTVSGETRYMSKGAWTRSGKTVTFTVTHSGTAVTEEELEALATEQTFTGTLADDEKSVVMNSGPFEGQTFSKR